jgi:hypothetical protein
MSASNTRTSVALAWRVCQKRVHKYRELLERDIRKDQTKKILKKIRKEIDNAKEYGTNNRQELFHYSGIYAILDAIKNEEEYG